MQKNLLYYLQKPKYLNKGEGTMNKAEMINYVAEAADLKKADAKAAVDAVLEGIAKALVAGEKVQIAGFGTFAVKAHAAREGRNPATGEKISIPASKSVAFSAGKSFKEEINK